MLLILLFAVDFGRLFYSWVTVTNAARVAANYAAINPGTNFATDADYRDLVVNDALNAICPVTTPPAGPPSLLFEDMDGNGTTKGLGDKVTARITCDFGVLTPVISGIVGSPVKIGASATFKIRTGALDP
jgi:Flp pilus assembly protein TadG